MKQRTGNCAVTGPKELLIELTKVLEENGYRLWDNILKDTISDRNELYIILGKKLEYFFTYRSCAITDNWFNIETQREELFTFLQIPDPKKGVITRFSITGTNEEIKEWIEVLEEKDYSIWKGCSVPCGTVLNIGLVCKDYFSPSETWNTNETVFNANQKEEIYEALGIEYKNLNNNLNNNNMSNIGRKVRITKGYKEVYPEYVGKIGTIIDDSDPIYFEVKMEDDEYLIPYKPDYCIPQYEFVGEPEEIKPFIVTGNKHLLEAFEKELEQIGYTRSTKRNTDKISVAGENKTQYFYFDVIEENSTKTILNLPEQWNEAVDLAKELFDSLNNGIKVGDWIKSLCTGRWGQVKEQDNNFYKLVCPAEDITDGSGIVGNQKGNAVKLTTEQVNELFIQEAKQRGYKEGLRIISALNGSTYTLSITECPNGLRKDGFAYLDKYVWTEKKGWAKILEENVHIEGYDVSYREGKVHFGCQSFPKEELQTVLKLLNSPINASITIGKTQITQEIISNLLKMFK